MLVNTCCGGEAFTRTSSHQQRSSRGVRSRHEELTVARRFYCDLLGGRQVWRTGVAESRRTLWFMVNQQVIAVPLDRRSERRLTTLEVDDPAAIAEQCWDRGHDVFVGEEDAGDQLVVVDPFGHRIQLLAPEWSTGGEDGFAQSSR